jgi:hypothetical protein
MTAWDELARMLGAWTEPDINSGRLTVIAHRTFADCRIKLTARGALGKWERLRQEAEAFIARELSDEQVVNVTEAGSNYGTYCHAVTVWYRKK